MPRLPQTCWSSAPINSASITPAFLLDFLAPFPHQPKQNAPCSRSHIRHLSNARARPRGDVESIFFSALSAAGACSLYRTKERSVTSRQRAQSRFSVFARLRAFARAVEDEDDPVQDLKRWHDDEGKTMRLEGQPDPGGTGRRRSRAREPHNLTMDFFDAHTQDFATNSHLPQDFFDDIQHFQFRTRDMIPNRFEESPSRKITSVDVAHGNLRGKQEDLKSKLALLASVRTLEEKLARAKEELQVSVRSQSKQRIEKSTSLTKEDYTNLVDLYHYTHKKRFTPESPDYSPTPTFLEDYSFKLSEDFAPPRAYARYYENEEGYESPLREIEQSMRSSQLREVAVMQDFVDLLLDDHSSNRALFKVYRKLPDPGVAYLPRGIVRLFLQRMSTPWTRTTIAMIRYLSLIDDMQKANLPITKSEWSSAIYLAGRTFSQMSDKKALPEALQIWRRMEKEADVKANNVTFNILFDIAVRAGKYVFADTLLREMHSRGLRLDRLGRVGLIYYHGIRQDGDAIRKTYRDFVDAGEIVDTLVLNCVIASLNNAQENTAAEQTYERMKDMHLRRKHAPSDPDRSAYRRYPNPGSSVIDGDIASNSLGRMLGRASRLRSILPEHHQQLQHAMPLTPNHETFKALIPFHANTTGDLDRIVVLLKDMVEIFKLTLTRRTFQVLFKGFALHGHCDEPHTKWSADRLDAVWDKCREAIKATLRARRGTRAEAMKPVLPTVAAVEALGPSATSSMQTDLPGEKKLHNWYDFVLDLAAFPRERRKPIERIHAQLFDEDNPVKKSKFDNPLFPVARTFEPFTEQRYYSLGHMTMDREEGEYTLPSPAETIDPDHTAESDVVDQSSEEPNVDDEREPFDHEIVATRSLVCWVLRAYSTCYGSRAKLEEVWNSIKKVYHPRDGVERESVLRVLRRCLRDCDRRAQSSR